MSLCIYFITNILQMVFVARLNELRPQGGQILLTLIKFLPSPEKGACKALVISLTFATLNNYIFSVQTSIKEKISVLGS